MNIFQTLRIWFNANAKSSLFSLIIILLVTSKSLAQVVAIGASGSASGTNTIVNYNIPAGNNRLLVVTASDAASTNITGVTFAGNAMVERVEENDGVAVDAIYTYALGSGAASTGTIIINSANGSHTYKVILARVFENVDQTNPISVTNKAKGSTPIGAVSSSLTLASAPDDLVIDLFDTYSDFNSTTNHTAGGGQTIINTLYDLNLGGANEGFWSASTKAGALSVTMIRSTIDHDAFIHLVANIKYSNALPTVNLSVSTTSALEASTTVVTVTATASGPVTGNQTVNLAVTGAGITAGDYILSSATISILNGMSVGNVTFTVNNDGVNEATETATLTISSPSSGIILGPVVTHNVSITDATCTTCQVTALAGNAFNTGSNTLSFTVPAGNDRLLVVTASDVKSTTMSGATFNGAAMTEQLETTDTYAVDALYTLALGSSASPTTAPIVITSGNASHTHKAISAVVFVNVNQSAPVSGATSFFDDINPVVPTTNNLNVVSGLGDLVFDLFDSYKSAASANNHTLGSGQSVLHTINNFTVAPPSGGFEWWTSSTKVQSGTVTISRSVVDHNAFIHSAMNIEANPTPSVSLAVSTNSGSETAATVVTVYANTSGPVTNNQTVNLGVTGTNITAGDYNLSNNVITIPNGSTQGSVTFTIVDDSNLESTETATLTISSPSSGIVLGSPLTQNITITDNDCPDLSAASTLEVVVTNSVCNTGCVAVNGLISAPMGSCVAGTTVEYTTDNGMTWSATLPVYDQDGPAQNIKTRCRCTINPSIFSPASVGVTTNPPSCTTTTCYQDSDNDTYGNASVSQVFCGPCGMGFVSNDDDCNDNSNAVNIPPYIITLNGICYASIESALAVAVAGNTIQINGIITSIGTNTIPAGVTIQINNGAIWTNNTSLTNNGIIVEMGTGDFINGSNGTYKGKGTFNGSFMNNGSMSPGN